MEERWTAIKTITNELTDKMEKRRKFEKLNTKEGKNTELREKIVKARAKWLAENFKEIEDMDRVVKHNLVYNRVKH
ncbi:hypothetical protein ILUMI_21230 [Ignelater luminosus]|uniref:Uncharacterized protein n=1 Tax=Ignelater luminosus TaxID=2038154 RepID=A0A8K0G435_IGNLU|nr:hypothetical protein ILUMI_21230 [Ignelater luminosus]